MAIINLKKFSKKILPITTPKGFSPSVFIIPEDVAAGISMIQDDQFAIAAYISSKNGEKVLFGITWARAQSLILSEFDSTEEAENSGIEMVAAQEFNMLMEEFDDYVTNELTNPGTSFEFKNEKLFKIKKPNKEKGTI